MIFQEDSQKSYWKEIKGGKDLSTKEMSLIWSENQYSLIGKYAGGGLDNFTCKTNQ